MYHAIAVGTDGSATATEAVRRAAHIAAALDIPLHVVTAHRTAPVMAWAAAGEVPLPADAWTDCLAAMAADAQALVQRSEDDLRAQGVRASGHAVPGNPADVILTVAAAEGADLIVVGNRGMHGPRRVLGSVPNAVSHRAGCDVLIVSTT